MGNAFKEIDRLEKTKIQVDKKDDYSDLFPLCILVGTILLLSEAILSQTLWRRLP